MLVLFYTKREVLYENRNLKVGTFCLLSVPAPVCPAVRHFCWPVSDVTGVRGGKVTGGRVGEVGASPPPQELEQKVGRAPADATPALPSATQQHRPPSGSTPVTPRPVVPPPPPIIFNYNYIKPRQGRLMQLPEAKTCYSGEL